MQRQVLEPQGVPHYCGTLPRSWAAPIPPEDTLVYWFEKSWYWLIVKNGHYYLDGKLESLNSLNKKDKKGRLVPVSAGGIKTIPSGLYPKNTLNFELNEPFMPLTTPTQLEFPSIEELTPPSTDEPLTKPEPSLNTISL